MEFSNIISFSNIYSFSTNNVYFAIVKEESTLIIYNMYTFTINKKIHFEDKISKIDFSPDSTLILIAFYKEKKCEIYSIENKKWKCIINQSNTGINNFIWTPDSRKIIIFNYLNIRLSIYSLIDNSIKYIKSPKIINNGISFNSNGQFLFLSTKEKNKDFIEIYSTNNFELINKFKVNTFDLKGFKLKKDNSSIIVYDNKLKSKFSIYSPFGNLYKCNKLNNKYLSIITLKFSPCENYLSIGFNDGFLRIYNCLNWNLILELNHNKEIYYEYNNINYYLEDKYNYIKGKFPLKLNFDNLIGIGNINIIEWNFDSTFIASYNNSLPKIVFIWNVKLCKLNSIIVHNNIIKDFKWSPKENILCIVTNNEKIYSFSFSNFKIYICSKDNLFKGEKVLWDWKGKDIFIFDDKKFIIGYLKDNK